MVDQSKSKVIGAFVVGIAIVAGAYTMSNFGKTYSTQPANLTATVAEAPERVQINVIDSNDDGIEDWREDFIDNTPTIYRATADEDYTLPDTLTGQVGIAFLQNYIRSEGRGALGKSKEEMITETVNQVSKFATDKIFDIKDVIVSGDTSDFAIRSYANQLADSIIGNSVPGLEHELLILQEAINTQDAKKVANLITIANVYKNTRDAALALPVPPQLVKQHLDFINVCNALYNDIDSMSKALTDPMVSLIRLKRYEDDALGLSYAMQNFYSALEPFAGAFEKNDSAILFVGFSPKLQ